MIAALALLVVIGDSNAVPWIIHEDLGYVRQLEAALSTHVEALPLPGAGFAMDPARARHAVRTAYLMGATTIVLALGTADVAHDVSPRRIAKRARRRYEQALAIAERVVVVGCFQPTMACVEVWAALKATIPSADLAIPMDLHSGPQSDLLDSVHLNASGHRKVAAAIEERLR